MDLFLVVWNVGLLLVGFGFFTLGGVTLIVLILVLGLVGSCLAVHLCFSLWTFCLGWVLRVLLIDFSLLTGFGICGWVVGFDLIVVNLVVGVWFSFAGCGIWLVLWCGL